MFVNCNLSIECVLCFVSLIFICMLFYISCLVIDGWLLL